MSGSKGTGTTGAASGGERRVGQAVVVAVCICSLVVAGAIAPSVGAPFDDGPALNASELARDAGLANASGLPSGSQDLAEKGAGSGSNPPSAIGAPGEYQVGGPEGLTGFRNQSGGVQFVVQAPENTYYRVGAYQSFDGYGWSRQGDQTAFSGAVPGPTPPGERVEARVTLNATAFSVPVPWKPTAVDGPVPLSVRETGGIVPRTSLASGQSFTVTAVQPTRDPDLLSSTGYDYPDRIEETYTTVDDDVDPRVVELADEVTADADDPYEEARAIEQWLESNKEYSLEATTDPDRPVTRQFLFEMERGYCQYFASSMAVMLRSQGIPARYVVGYAPGTEIGENTYAVTGSKAHAWVEVYFEDVGWVRMDPTPAAGREAADEAVANQSQVVENFEESELSEQVTRTDAPEEETTTSPEAGTTTSPGSETTTTEEGTTPPDEGTTTSGGGETDDDGNDSSDESSGLDVFLNRTPSPGADVTVTVLRDGEPVRGADVYFNDEYVGATGFDGEVVATVPYASNLNVSVRDVEGVSRTSVAVPGPSTATDGGLKRFDAGAIPRSAFDASGSALDLPPPDAGTASVTDHEDAPDNGTSREYEVNTDMSFSMEGDPVPGATVRMQVSIDGRPLPSADVRLDGEYVGRTSRDGWVRVSLPEDEEAVTVSASRDRVNDSATLQLWTTANVTVEGAAVPGRSLHVNAEFQGEPLSGAAVLVDGERVGSTDDFGNASVDVPVNAGETVTVTVRDGVVSGSVEREVLTNASFQFEEPPAPGATVLVRVTAENRSVQGATVSVENETMGETDDAGRTEVSIPADATGNVTVSAELGSLSSSREVDLFEPNLTVTPAYLVALPGANVTANVTDDGEPVPGATVAVGESTSTTGANGTVEAKLPWKNAVTVSASALTGSDSTRVDWLFLNLFGVLAVALALFVVGVGSVVQRGRLGAAARRARRLARRLGRAVVNALFALAATLDAWLSRLPGVPALVRTWLERAASAPVDALRALAVGVVAWALAALDRVATWLRGLFGDDGRDGASKAVAANGGVDAANGSGADAHRSLVAAWRVLVDLVAPSRLRTRTPGEVARLGVEKGLPTGPVRTLTDAYRSAMYGDAAPSDEDVERARAAASDLERAVADDEGDAADAADAVVAEGDEATSSDAESTGEGSASGEGDAARADGGDDS